MHRHRGESWESNSPPCVWEASVLHESREEASEANNEEQPPALDCGDSPGEEGRQGQAGWRRVEDRGVPGGAHILRGGGAAVGEASPGPPAASILRRFRSQKTHRLTDFEEASHPPPGPGQWGATDKTAAVVAVS